MQYITQHVPLLPSKSLNESKSSLRIAPKTLSKTYNATWVSKSHILKLSGLKRAPMNSTTALTTWLIKLSRNIAKILSPAIQRVSRSWRKLQRTNSHAFLFVTVHVRLALFFAVPFLVWMGHTLSTNIKVISYIVKLKSRNPSYSYRNGCEWLSFPFSIRCCRCRK
jgi:hypothetical protein